MTPTKQRVEGHEDLEKEVKLLKGLLRITISVDSLNVLLDNAIRLLMEIFPSDGAFIYLMEQDAPVLTLRAASRYLPDLVGHFSIRLGEGLTGWVAQEETPVVIPEKAYEDPRAKIFQMIPEDRFEAFLSVPLTTRERVVGVMNLHFRTRFLPKETEIELLMLLSQEMGFMIRHIHLFEEAQKKALQIEALSQVTQSITSSRYLEEILHLIVTVTAEMTSSTLCSIMIYEPERGLVVRAAQTLSEEYRNKSPLQVGESIAGVVFGERRAILVDNVQKDPRYTSKDLARKENLVSMLSVPMMIKDRAIGVVNVYTSHLHHFSKDEIKVLQSVANQAAIAWENTTLFEKTLAMEEALESRKKIDRAKGILMKKHRIGEEDAYRLLQKKSMNLRKSMKEIAEAVILAHDLRVD
jgi:GAF domain-containing protein